MGRLPIPALTKKVIEEAIKYADLGTLYGIAFDCFEMTGEYAFTISIYEKAIKWCYRDNNTSRLSLMGAQMLGSSSGYFVAWGKELVHEAKALSDKQKELPKETFESLLLEADLHRSFHKMQKALAIYRKLEYCYPYDHKVLLGIGKIMHEEKKYTEAFGYFKKILDLGYRDMEVEALLQNSAYKN